MLHSHINHEQESLDRKIQSMHHAITVKQNKQAEAYENNDFELFASIGEEIVKLSEKLGTM